MAQPNITFQTGQAATPQNNTIAETLQTVGAEHIQYIIEGSKATISREWHFTAAQTNTALITVIGTQRLLILYTEITTAGSNTQSSVSVRLGLTTATTLPALTSGGATGIISSHPGLVQGSGILRVKAKLGLAGENLLFTCTDPGGTLRVTVEFLVVDA